MITNILTHGDMRDSINNDLKARDYINTATDIAGVVYIGDYSGLDCSIFNINKPGFFVQGNHPGCGKGDLNLFVKDFLGTGIQASFPAYNYNSFNWEQIDQTKLSIVFVHINFIGRGCTHPIDKSLKAKIDGVKNLIVGACGHDHGSALDARTDRIYYIDSTPANIAYCGKEPFLLGWLQIDTNTPNKTIFRYARVDPYAGYNGVPASWLKEVVVSTGGPTTTYKCSGTPNFTCTAVTDGSGQYATLAECQAACKAPVTKYKCSGAPNYTCVIDPNGPYNTLAECQAACKAPVTKYRCTGSPGFQCVIDPNGPYNTLAECQAACKAPVTKYRCTGSPDFQCIVDPNGPYASLAECQNACKAPSPGSITVTTPSTGLIYRKGESRVIRWNSAGSVGPSVKIELSRTNKVVKTLASSTPNDGQMAWTVPSVTSGTDYTVKITSKTNAQIFGISGKFAIK